MKKALASILGLTTGNIPRLLYHLLVDAFNGLIRKVKWQIVVERFVSRAITIGLRWLEKRYSNQLLKVTVDAILEQLGSAEMGLPKIKEQDAYIQCKASVKSSVKSSETP